MKQPDMVTVQLSPKFGHTQAGIRHLPGAVIDVPRRVLEANPDRMTGLGIETRAVVHAVIPRMASDVATPEKVEVPPPFQTPEPSPSDPEATEEAESNPLVGLDFEGMNKAALVKMTDDLQIAVEPTGLSGTPLKQNYIDALEKAASEG